MRIIVVEQRSRPRPHYLLFTGVWLVICVINLIWWAGPTMPMGCLILATLNAHWDEEVRRGR